MKNVEAALGRHIVETWEAGFGDLLFEACGLPPLGAAIRANFRVPPTDIAWREFDLISDRFELEGQWCRLIIELKYGGVGYRSIGQVLFYKNVLLPRHSERLEAERFILAVIGAQANPKRWTGEGVLESDALAFLELFSERYWPDPDINVFSYSDLGLELSESGEVWTWNRNLGKPCSPAGSSP